MAVSLPEAIHNDDVVALESAIAAGADINASPAGDYEPPIFLAIEHKRVEMVRRLIAAGAQLNQQLSEVPGWKFGGEEWTPLVHAIDIESDSAWQAHHETGHESTELTELLLVAGAVPTRHAFEIAEQYGNNKALELLRHYAGQRLERGEPSPNVSAKV
jgi:hypothetical protein